MQKSESIGKLADALAKAQGEMRGASKDAKNLHFNNRYADLASIWEACRDSLAKHGLSIVQMPATSAKTVTMTTMLLHASGEWISGECSADAKDSGPQSIGSAVTYLRRYGLSAMVGVAPEDDDGEGAEGREPASRQSQSRPTSTETKLSISEMLYAAKTKADLLLCYERAKDELDRDTWPRFQADYDKKYEALKKAAQQSLKPQNGTASPADDGRA